MTGAGFYFWGKKRSARKHAETAEMDASDGRGGYKQPPNGSQTGSPVLSSQGAYSQEVSSPAASSPAEMPTFMERRKEIPQAPPPTVERQELAGQPGFGTVHELPAGVGDSEARRD